MLNNLALVYDAQGKHAEAESVFKRYLVLKERTLGPRHRGVAVGLNNLASMYLAQGRYAEAEPLFRRSLEIKEKVRGPDHPETSLALNNLGLLYLNLESGLSPLLFPDSASGSARFQVRLHCESFEGGPEGYS